MTKITILNTRATDQEKETSDAFVKHGFEVINFPCIEITSETDTKKTSHELNKITADDIVIFTSQYAVRHAYLINPSLKIPQACIAITVGTKTSQVLEQNYSGDIWIPEQQNSTGVIDLIKGLNHVKSIKLISGENGRNQIQEYAQNNSIKLQQINVYQRQLPRVDKATITLIEKVNYLMVLATSVTTLINLQKLLPRELFEKLKFQKLICASNRIKKAAIDLDFKDTVNFNTANSHKLAKLCTDNL